MNAWIVCKANLFVAHKGNVCPTNLTFPPDFTFLSVIAELHNLIVIAAKRPGANQFAGWEAKLQRAVEPIIILQKKSHT